MTDMPPEDDTKKNDPVPRASRTFAHKARPVVVRPAESDTGITTKEATLCIDVLVDVRRPVASRIEAFKTILNNASGFMLLPENEAKPLLTRLAAFGATKDRGDHYERELARSSLTVAKNIMTAVTQMGNPGNWDLSAMEQQMAHIMPSFTAPHLDTLIAKSDTSGRSH